MGSQPGHSAAVASDSQRAADTAGVGKRADGHPPMKKVCLLACPQRPAEALSSASPGPVVRARVRGRALVRSMGTNRIPLRRRDIRQAARKPYVPGRDPQSSSLRAWLGVIRAHDGLIQGIGGEKSQRSAARIHPTTDVCSIRVQYVIWRHRSLSPACQRINLLRGLRLGTVTGCWRRARIGWVSCRYSPPTGSRRAGMRTENRDVSDWRQVEVRGAISFPKRCHACVLQPALGSGRPSSPISTGSRSRSRHAARVPGALSAT